jgi:quercetin dioxygenase-like cupin family protein
MMALHLRRVVTGHDENGRSVAKIDEIAQRTFVNRPGATGCNIWTTEGFPINNDGDEDGSLRQVGTTLRNGTVFRVVEFAPGVAPRNHRTDSIDYAVVLSGEIDMVLDDGVVRLKAGDLLVQRGTIHNWINNGAEPCAIAFILIDATPARPGGKELPAVG